MWFPSDILFIAVAILYAADCTWLLRDRQMALQTWFGSRLRLSRNRLLVANPLPLGLTVRLNDWALCFDEHGLIVLGASGEPEGHEGWEAPGVIERDGARLVFGKAYWHTGSKHRAGRWAERLRGWRNLAADRRATAIREYLDRSLNTAAARSEARRFARAVQPLRIVLNAMVGVTLVLVLGFALEHALLPYLVLPLVLLLTVLHLSHAWLFLRARRTLTGEGGLSAWAEALPVLLSPLSALRSPEILSEHLFHDRHPLAVLHALGTQEDLIIEVNALLTMKESVAGTIHRQAVAAWLEREHIIIERATPRDGGDAEMRSWCRRCGAGYVLEAGTCADCGGDLVPGGLNGNSLPA